MSFWAYVVDPKLDPRDGDPTERIRKHVSEWFSAWGSKSEVLDKKSGKDGEFAPLVIKENFELPGYGLTESEFGKRYHIVGVPLKIGSPLTVISENHTRAALLGRYLEFVLDVPKPLLPMRNVTVKEALRRIEIASGDQQLMLRWLKGIRRKDLVDETHTATLPDEVAMDFSRANQAICNSFSGTKTWQFVAFEGQVGDFRFKLFDSGTVEIVSDPELKLRGQTVEETARVLYCRSKLLVDLAICLNPVPA